jgi:hypothetical protein
MCRRRTDVSQILRLLSGQIGYIWRMSLRWYAEIPARRIRQLTADVIAGLALLVCLWIGNGVHDLAIKLAAPGHAMEVAGADFAQHMNDAGATVSDIPLMGDTLQAAFDQSSDAGRAIEDAGVQQQDAVSTFAITMALISGGIPALFVLAVWLPPRIRYARRAAQAATLRDVHAGLDVFAFRALARRPIGDLARLRADPAAGWRTGDPEVIQALARLELRHLGLRPVPRRSIAAEGR